MYTMDCNLMYIMAYYHAYSLMYGCQSTSRVESVNSVTKKVVFPSFPLKDLFDAITVLSDQQSKRLINSINDNRFNTAAREGPVYGDVRLHLTKQAAREVDIEVASRDNYVALYLDAKPDIDWQADARVERVGDGTIVVGVRSGAHSTSR